jgi:hypothetical protein
MRNVCTAVLSALALLALSGSASATLIVGVNDDTPKNPALAPWFYSTMVSERLQVDTISLRWDENAPTSIPNESYVAQAISAANAKGITTELDLYPLHSQVFTGGSQCTSDDDPLSCGNSPLIQQFARWTALVSRTFPTVYQFVVMNECNQPLFVNPQWDASGQNQSAEICGRALAAAYDALKAVSSLNFVWGVGLSPRGNDTLTAASNSSTSPVNFLLALGQWFRAFAQATQRTAPLMDGLDFHPYPVPQSLAFATGYTTPNNASVSNLPRIYQAFYSGFNGTPQKTIGQQPGGGLPVSLNETGVQTDSSAHATAYTGTEVSATAAGGVLGEFATEAYQASWYQQMLSLVACDPNVRLVNIFHLLDETALSGWQSGLFYADQTPKQSAQVVQGFVASGGTCQGAPAPWTPPGVSAGPALTPVTIPMQPPPAAPSPGLPGPPAGCTGACAGTLRSVQTACTVTSTVRARCGKAVLAAQAQLAALRLVAVAPGVVTTRLRVQIAAYVGAIESGTALLDALARPGRAATVPGWGARAVP